MHTHQTEEKIIRPDARGRIALGKMAKGVSGFKAIYDHKTHKITLEPYTEIPLNEKWIFENPEILASIERGIEQSMRGQLIDRGSFDQYRDE